MDRTYSIPSNDSERRQASRRWPVLARLPDVTAELPAAAQPVSRAAAPVALEYRFDPPQTRGAEPAVRVESRWREKRRESAILPSTDPFAIPAQTLQQTLVPVARFLMLVALFTVAGTIILLSRSERRPTLSRQPKAFTQQSLQPVVTAMEPAVSVPTAQGPIEPANATLGETNAQSSTLPPLAPAEGTVPAAEAPAADAVSHTVPERVDSGGDVQGGMTTNSDQALPQVQTADPPRAVAHLPGYILEAPARQASNDDDQSSVY